MSYKTFNDDVQYGDVLSATVSIINLMNIRQHIDS